MTLPVTPRVFISATTRDLGSYRLEVREVLLELGVHPVVQDDFPPDYRSVREILRSKVEGCDAVLCLIGPSYGREPVQRDDGAPRRSYTQMEYDLASELKKRIFLFVATKECPLDNPVSEDESLLQLQRAYLDELRETDHSRTSFRSKANLADQVRILRFDPVSLKQVESRTVVLLVAGFADSGAQRSELGEEAWVRTIVSPAKSLLKQVLDHWEGTVQSETPTEWQVSFSSAEAAVQAALEWQAVVRTHAWAGMMPRLKIGIHLGQTLHFHATAENQVLQTGLAVDLCRRLMEIAQGGQILLTGTAFDHARESLGAARSSDRERVLEWLAHGRYQLPDVSPSCEIYEVGMTGAAPLTPPPDSPLARRADSLEEQQMRGWRPSLEQEIPHKPGWIIQQKLGEGGFGEVWLAQQTKTRQPRVFKFCFDAERLRSFKREMTLFRLLRSSLGERSDIAKLLDVQLDDPPFFLESEFVAGGNLKTWAAQQGGLAQIPLKERVRILAEIARAVSAAHSVGIIHKDLKPTNIFMQQGADGLWHPILADFGIGALADRSRLQEHQITETGFTESLLFATSSRTGTRLYAPPESLVGKAGTVQGDVYALGVLLYQMLVADFDRPVGTGWDEEIPLELSDPNSTETAELRRLLIEDARASLLKMPERRLGSASEFADRMERLDERVAERVQRGRNERLRRKLRKFQIATAVTVGVATVSLVLAVWINQERDSKAKLADRNRDLADRNRQLAEKTAERAKAEADARERAERSERASLERQRRLQISLAENRFEFGVREYADGRLESGVRNLLLAWQTLPPENPLSEGYFRVLLDRATRGDAQLVPHMQHEAAVQRVAYSPDGTRLVTGSDDKTARLWDVAAGAPLGEPMRHQSPVSGVAFSADGSRVLTASGDMARVWDAAEGRPLSDPLKHADYIFSAAFSPDGTRVLTGSKDKTACIWDVATGKPVFKPIPQYNWVTGVAFGPDGKRILTKGFDHNARLWDASTGEPLGAVGCDGFSPWVAFSPDGTRFVTTTSWKGAARLFDACTAEPIGEPMPHEDHIEGLAFSPDGRRVLTGSWDRTARLWDGYTGQPLSQPLKHGDSVGQVAFSPDGTRFLAVSLNNVYLWDTDTGIQLGEPLRHDDAATSAAFSPDGTRVVTGSRDYTARVWDVAASAPYNSLWDEDRMLGVAFSPDGTRLLTENFQKTARLWDVVAGKPLGAPIPHEGSVQGVAFSPDGLRFLTGSDHTVRFWEVATGKPQGEPMRHKDWIKRVAFSPDGSCILTVGWELGSGASAQLWNAKTCKRLWGPMSCRDSIEVAAFAPDGTRILIMSDEKTLRLIDTPTGRPLGAPMVHDERVLTGAFSPDGTKLVSAGDDKTARLWNATTGDPLGAAMRHTESVLSVAFSPDSRSVMTGSGDHSLRLWNATTGLPWGEPMYHDSGVASVAFSPDGRRLVSGCWDKTAALWDATTRKRLNHTMRHAATVSSVAFSPDSTRVITRSAERLFFWAPSEWRFEGHSRAMQTDVIELWTGLRAEADATLRKLTPEELQEIRRRFPEGDPLSGLQHRKADRSSRMLAQKAMDRRQWFAADFHARRTLRVEPRDAEMQKLFERAEQRLHPPETLQDGSFEGELADAWNIDGGNFPVAVVVDDTVHGGRKSIRFQPTQAEEPRCYQLVAVKPGCRYRLTGWVKIQDGSKYLGARLTAGAKDIFRTWAEDVNRSSWEIDAHEWTQLQLDFDAQDERVVEIGFRAGPGKVGGSVWCDDLVLIELPKTGEPEVSSPAPPKRTCE